MLHVFAMSTLLATGLVTHDAAEPPPTVVVSLRATVVAPLNVQVLNDSERSDQDKAVVRTRIVRDLNTGVIQHISTNETLGNSAS